MVVINSKTNLGLIGLAIGAVIGLIIGILIGQSSGGGGEEDVSIS